MTVISMGIRCLCLAYRFYKIVTEMKIEINNKGKQSATL